MYADKRDAGKSETQIIEEFGAPYDVAKKILAESKDAAATQGGQPDGAANVSGGNNYNYNYYNYNYGGASHSETPSNGKELPAQSAPPPAHSAPAAAKAKKKKNAGQIIVGIILGVLLTALSVMLIGSCIVGIIQGFVTAGMAVGMLAAGKSTAATTTLNAGYGIACAGLSFILLAPFNLLVRTLWKKLKNFV